MPIMNQWDAIADEGTGYAVRKRSIAGERASLVRVSIVAGTRAERHFHAFEQFVQVLSGAGTLDTKEGQQAFSAGSVFHFLPGTWHAARFDEDTILVETNLT